MKARCAMKNLLVAVVFSDVTGRVMATAEQLARAFGLLLSKFRSRGNCFSQPQP